MTVRYTIPLELEPQPDGGFTVTCPLLPELITEGDTYEEALANVEDAFQVVREIYEDDGLSLPAELISRGPFDASSSPKNRLKTEYILELAS